MLQPKQQETQWRDSELPGGSPIQVLPPTPFPTIAVWLGATLLIAGGLGLVNLLAPTFFKSPVAPAPITKTSSPTPPTVQALPKTKTSNPTTQQSAPSHKPPGVPASLPP